MPTVTFRTSVGPNYCENHPIFKYLGIKPKHTLYYDNNRVALGLLAQTNGWALMPDVVIKKYSNHLEELTMPRSWDAPVTISLIKNKNPGSAQLMNIIEQHLKGNISL